MSKNIKIKNIILASDHAGFELKEEILKVNRDLLLDLGTKNKDRVDYPDFALTLVDVFQIFRSILLQVPYQQNIL